MSDRERLHEIVASLPESQLQAVIEVLEHLHRDTEPLSEEELANIQASLDDIAQGRVTSLDEYERRRGM